MAEKTEKVLERVYVIPLRRYYLNTQPYLRAKKSMSIIRNFLKRHMKSENVKLGKELNELIWSRGGKKVPGKVKVTAKKEGDLVTANLAGVVKKEPKKEKKKAAAKKSEPKKETKIEVPQGEE